MNMTILLQARTNSSRLPAKVLLPVKGIPLVVLAAFRAGNTGKEVLVVTSNEESDSLLCNVLSSWKVPYFRGSLNNTLKRFVDALSGKEDDHVVVRLTGDNVFPDGNFIDEVVKEFLDKGCEYICCIGEESGLPYGLTVEVTKLEHLRTANNESDSTFDREHVTPWVINRFGREFFTKYSSVGMGGFRCTVDNLDDYLSLSKIFDGIEEPKGVGFMDLVEKLKGQPLQPIVKKPASKIVLGTAQLGIDYGVTNQVGKPSQAESEKIIKTAVVNGIEWIDTARSYGDSEYVIGEALSRGWQSRVGVITKLSHLNELRENSSRLDVITAVQKSIYLSCHALRCQSIEVLLLHKTSHLTDWGGAVKQSLLELQRKGVIKHIGVSVSHPDELESILDQCVVSFLQLPFNILDHRWEKLIPRIKLVRLQRELIIHARSVYLQGLLLSKSTEIWNKANCKDSKLFVDWLLHESKILNVSISTLCMAYVNAQSWIDGIVVGVDNCIQFIENLYSLNSIGLSDDYVIYLEEKRPFLDNNTLNPSLWNNKD